MHGLRVLDIPSFKNSKEKVSAEVTSNLNELLFTPSNTTESDKKLIECIRLLWEQLKALKITNPNIIKLITTIETLSRSNKESAEGRSHEAEKTTSDVKEYIRGLEKEIQRLLKENEELKMTNESLNQFGDDLLLKKIQDLEKIIEEEKQKYNLLAIETMQKDDQINELKDMLKGKGLVTTKSFDYEAANETLKKLEEKNELLSKNVKTLEKENAELKANNKKLEQDFATALQELAKLGDSDLAREQRKKLFDMNCTTIKVQSNKLQEIFFYYEQYYNE